MADESEQQVPRSRKGRGRAVQNLCKRESSDDSDDSGDSEGNEGSGDGDGGDGCDCSSGGDRYSTASKG